VPTPKIPRTLLAYSRLVGNNKVIRLFLSGELPFLLRFGFGKIRFFRLRLNFRAFSENLYRSGSHPVIAVWAKCKMFWNAGTCFRENSRGDYHLLQSLSGLQPAAHPCRPCCENAVEVAGSMLRIARCKLIC
jgi:hypothetical protein